MSFIMPDPSPTKWQPGPKSFKDLLNEEFYGGQPEAGFYNVFPQAYKSNPYGQFLRGSQTRAYNKYLSELPQNPNRSFRDFLGGLDLGGEFAGLAPSQRGETFRSPQVRFANRTY